MNSAPRQDDHSRAPIVLIGLVCAGIVATGCAVAVALGLVGRARGWW